MMQLQNKEQNLCRFSEKTVGLACSSKFCLGEEKAEEQKGGGGAVHSDSISLS